MAKYYDAVGYVIQKEVSPGVWEDETVEKKYRGDVILNQLRWQIADKVNDDINIDNSISIIADPFAFDNVCYMKYIKWIGKKWKIQSFSIQRPRVVLQLGGVYNG